ncbi:hypothetical protein LCGC14_2925350, partial [marine sediment metagenome]
MATTSSFVDQFSAYSIFPDSDVTQISNIINGLSKNAYSPLKSLFKKENSDLLHTSLNIELNIFKEIIENKELNEQLNIALSGRID